jgi:hypothetical protein
MDRLKRSVRDREDAAAGKRMITAEKGVDILPVLCYLFKDDCRRQQVPKGVRYDRLPRSMNSSGMEFVPLCIGRGVFFYSVRSNTCGGTQIYKEVHHSWQKLN